MISRTTKQFLAAKVRALAARAGRLATLAPNTVGIRAQDKPYAPSADHFIAANKRLGEIDRAIKKRMDFLLRQCQKGPPPQTLLYIALVEREVDRARRAFGMFFEIFSQRGSVFAPALAAHDVIAADCYAAVRKMAPRIFRGPLLKPLTYMEHGYSPATMRRGVSLSRLLGERNPFPIIRIPWDRDNPWQAVFLHEVCHNLQADLGLWHENKQSVTNRMLRSIGDPMVTSVYSRWHKEIFADIASILLGGPASAWGLMGFLAHPAPKTLTYKPGGAHPTGYLRVLILAEMLRRMGFEDHATKMQKVWKGFYQPKAGHRIPVRLLETSTKTIPHVVDEIAFQTRRNLAQRALADVIPFRAEDERQILQASKLLARGILPMDVSPRFLVSASSYALQRDISLQKLSKMVLSYLAKMATRQIPGQKRSMLVAA
ncbi:MAG: hypothetical protein MRJ65_11960 [Candidatus Brocadiaceae bacterium]|nr:hypothetical protein [Candidatus Brocadiaceae bacterium]